MAFRPTSGIDEVFYQNYLLQLENAARAQALALYNGETQRRWARATQLNTVIDDVADQGIFYLTALTTQNLIAGATSVASGAAADDLRKFGKIAGALQRQRSGQWRQAFDLLGQEATKATVASYKRVHASRERGTSAEPYRKNAPGSLKRYAGGELLDALNSKNMWVARPNGIAFVNVSWLDARAKQWARLNFGVAPRGNASRSQNVNPYSAAGFNTNRAGISYDVRFMRQATESSAVQALSTGMRFGFSSIGARPPMMIPSGIWFGAGPDGRNKFGKPNPARRGLDSLTILSRENRTGTMAGKSYQDRKISQGVAAWGFLNAGAAVIAREAPRMISALVMDGITNAHNGRGGKVAFDVGIDASQGREIARAFSRNIDSLFIQKLRQTPFRGGSGSILSI